ncbi:MAG: aspartyl protease family protein [Vicinamibacterales bacterium]
MRVPRLAWVGVWAVLLPLGIRAQTAQSGATAADVQLQLADVLFADGRYQEARDAYRRATLDPDPAAAGRAAAGVVLSQLRAGAVREALTEAQIFLATLRADALLTAVHGDALWACGLFEEADAAYDAALVLDRTQARARHGHGRSLATRNQLTEAMEEVQAAVRLDPRDPEFHSTVGSLYQRMHRYQDAAAAYADYVSLLPNRDRGGRALWVRETIRFLRSFDRRVPLDFGTQPEDQVWRVPVRLVGEKVFVRGKVNGVGTDFVLDTGAEQTVISRDVARRAGVAAITYTESAGVGDAGFRGLQIGRIDTLEMAGMKVRNIPALIKNPPLGTIPGREPDAFSPLALGLSMRMDYRRRELTMSRQMPAATYATQLPLRMNRLATVRGTVNGSLQASFVVDTGGEVISISGATADRMVPPNPYRRIPLKVYGTSGWDKEAFLMPFVDLAFSEIRFNRIPVVVLNLRAPSALLGYQLGGIVGHRFLSRYTVTVDLTRSILGLDIP